VCVCTACPVMCGLRGCRERAVFEHIAFTYHFAVSSMIQSASLMHALVIVCLSTLTVRQAVLSVTVKCGYNSDRMYVHVSF